MNRRIPFHVEYLLNGKTPEQIEGEHPSLKGVWQSIRGGAEAPPHYGRPYAWHQQAAKRSGYVPPPPREYTVQRCETRYREEWQERVDGYRVTYVYHGQEQVTEMPYKPGDRIRVRVDVTPAQ